MSVMAKVMNALRPAVSVAVTLTQTAASSGMLENTPKKGPRGWKTNHEGRASPFFRVAV